MSPPKASKGRAAIVTGAARSIGRAVAIRLAQDGYDVAILDLSTSSEALNAVAEEIRAEGRKSIAVTGDVRNEQDVQGLVDKTVAELGPLYVMVANAGIGKPAVSTVDMSLDLWNRFISINLTGVFLCYKAAGKQMLKQGNGGRIIGASSAAGKRGGPEMCAYSASKFGIRGLTQAMASELATSGITVNAYAPGYIEGPMLTEADQDFSEKRGVPLGTLTGAFKATTPMGRGGTHEDVAGLVSYMVSDEADFMTGQTVSLNGGAFYD